MWNLFISALLEKLSSVLSLHITYLILSGGKNTVFRRD